MLRKNFLPEPVLPLAASQDLRARSPEPCTLGRLIGDCDQGLRVTCFLGRLIGACDQGKSLYISDIRTPQEFMSDWVCVLGRGYTGLHEGARGPH